ncbi:MAG: DNA-protecting protein DprA [Rhodospirillaceae bacterium]|nr:DNA-protecting protein DprA [Rhodospirillaceae bacterium]|tara:strand:- start:27382 stop:28506 length:1125 start_codon:yes stop_codon:yes gene_type:complete
MDNESRTLSREERRDWLRLIRSENVGPATFRSLIERYGSAAKAIDAAPELSRRGGKKRAIHIIPEFEAEDEISIVEEHGGTLIALCEPDYPQSLSTIHDPPPIVQVLGDTSLLNKPSIGIVGARNASAAGRVFAREIAGALGKEGLIVASGLARGIDTAAHEGALESGTIAVVAGGIDIVYPRENEPLYENIVQSGAIISEQPFGTTPTARHFPPRNRLISGLSFGVLVVEAALRSGSLITARMALEQGREVFSVPGSPRDPRHKGTNGLLRDGATLTETTQDIISQISPMLKTVQASLNFVKPLPTVPKELPENETSEARDHVYGMLGPVAVSIDELLRECQLSPAVVLTVLLELELAGRLERHPGNLVSLIS